MEFPACVDHNSSRGVDLWGRFDAGQIRPNSRNFTGALVVMATILAAANAKPDLGILPLIVLAVALAVAGTLAYRVYRDVKGEPEGPLTEPDDLLGPLTEAYASGQMSREEYLRARAAVDRTGLGEVRSTLPIRPEIDRAGRKDDPAAEGTPTLPGDESGRE